MQEVKFFWWIPVSTLVPFDLMTKFGMVIQVAEKCVLGSQTCHHPNSEGLGPQSSQVLGPATCTNSQTHTHTHSMRNNNQILHDDETRCEENVYRVGPTPVCPSQYFGNMNADAQSACIS